MSDTAHVDCNAQTALDIDAARRNAKLDVAATRGFLHGGENVWKARERIVEILSADPVFDKSQRYYWSRKEAFEKVLVMQNRCQELRQKHFWDEKDMYFVNQGIDETMPKFVDDDAFEYVMLAQSSDELIAELGPLIKSRGILGAYALTELGHGSNVAQYETTATYIIESEEFEINSPTLTSMKWWPCSLGKTTNYAVVQARLILPGSKDMGPHLFLVQLRSTDTHESLPGVNVGDLGPKVMGGFASEDNGYARFDHVRIPRKHMLSKFAQVTKEGVYVTPPRSNLSFKDFLIWRFGRLTLVGPSLAKAATISLRFATVRRQGNSKDGLECQIISYPSVHGRLLPILSRAYVYTLLAGSVVSSYNKLSDQLSQEDTSALPDMHAIASGLKSLVTSVAAQDLEVARRAMGGHGYSAYAGIGREYVYLLPSLTYEGDNFILDQQVARSALKAFRQLSAAQGSSVHSYLRLLQDNKANSQAYAFEGPDWADSQAVIEILEWRAARAVQSRALSQKAGTVDGSSDQRISRAVSEAYIATQVGEMMSSLSREGFGKESKAILKSLLHLYLLSTAETALVDLLSLCVISPHEYEGKEPAEMLRLELARCCAHLLPEAISLTDAFGYTDWELDSAIGVYDGRVYEELWRRVQTEPLNQTDVTDGYESALKPLLERGKALANKEIKSKL